MYLYVPIVPCFRQKQPFSTTVCKKAFRQEKSKQPKTEIKNEKEAAFGPGMSKLRKTAKEPYLHGVLAAPQRRIASLSEGIISGLCPEPRSLSPSGFPGRVLAESYFWTDCYPKHNGWDALESPERLYGDCGFCPLRRGVSCIIEM